MAPIMPQGSTITAAVVAQAPRGDNAAAAFAAPAPKEGGSSGGSNSKPQFSLLSIAKSLAAGGIAGGVCVPRPARPPHFGVSREKANTAWHIRRNRPRRPSRFGAAWRCLLCALARSRHVFDYRVHFSGCGAVFLLGGKSLAGGGIAGGVCVPYRNRWGCSFLLQAGMLWER